MVLSQKSYSKAVKMFATATITKVVNDAKVGSSNSNLNFNVMTRFNESVGAQFLFMNM